MTLAPPYVDVQRRLKVGKNFPSDSECPAHGIKVSMHEAKWNGPNPPNLSVAFLAGGMLAAQPIF